MWMSMNLTMDSSSLVMPLRLIDIATTLKFRDSGGLYFTRQSSWHVISHTWSADVREFSIVIGELAAKKSAISYETLFESAGFGSHPAYLQLIDFLTILHRTFVKWVWFDAVCINQKDSAEKDREIQNMGTYYQKSLGCYVVHHGFGRGFTLLLDVASCEKTQESASSEYTLPRWYSRAWTFQEWVLPPSVTFILDLSAEKILRKTACIASSRHQKSCASSVCLCCDMSWKFVFPSFLLDCIHAGSSQPLGFFRAFKSVLPSFLSKRFRRDYNLTLYTNKSCHHFTRVPAKDHWYFTDDVGYAFLFKLNVHIKNAHGSLGEDSVLLDNAQTSMTERMVAKNSVLHSRIQGPGSKGNLISHESNINEVVEEISIRNCSNPEDRVLSMLKLLGVEQMLQVRTGRTLQGQLIELGRSLLEAEQEEMLLKLCLVDPFGNGMPGMSWMPAFEVKKGSWQEEARYLSTWMSLSFRFMDFKYNKATSMRCLGISNVTGELEMEGHVCTGHLIFCEHDKSMQEYRVEEFDERDKSFYEKYQSRTAVLQVDGQAVFHLCARVSVKTTCYLQGVDRDQRWAYSYIAFPTPDVHALQQIPVYMVALGNVEKKGMCLLVCIGDQKSGLHKIGYILGLNPSWFEINSRLICFKIGGQGDWTPNIISL